MKEVDWDYRQTFIDKYLWDSTSLVFGIKDVEFIESILNPQNLKHLKDKYRQQEAKN